jgi:CBS domain-containing protein
MIVRILGEGQFELPEGALEELNTYDATLHGACESGDEAAFHAALDALLGRVRELGTPVADDHLGPSELIFPSADASLAEVAELMSEEGLIPG